MIGLTRDLCVFATGVVADDKILAFMLTQPDVQACAEGLGQLALDSGSRDNVSCTSAMEPTRRSASVSSSVPRPRDRRHGGHTSSPFSSGTPGNRSCTSLAAQPPQRISTCPTGSPASQAIRNVDAPDRCRANRRS
jgi:hypothetical protein